MTDELAQREAARQGIDYAAALAWCKQQGVVPEEFPFGKFGRRAAPKCGDAGGPWPYQQEGTRHA